MRFLPLLLLLAACAPALDSEANGSVKAAEGSSHNQIAFDYFLGKGLKGFQVAGIIGNLDQESSMSPTIQQPGGPGMGIAQWSEGGRWDTDRNDNVVAFAAAHDQSPTSLSLQLDFIWYELTTFPGFGPGRAPGEQHARSRHDRVPERLRGVRQLPARYTYLVRAAGARRLRQGHAGVVEQRRQRRHGRCIARRRGYADVHRRPSAALLLPRRERFARARLLGHRQADPSRCVGQRPRGRTRHVRRRHAAARVRPRDDRHARALVLGLEHERGLAQHVGPGASRAIPRSRSLARSSTRGRSTRAVSSSTGTGSRTSA